MRCLLYDSFDKNFNKIFVILVGGGAAGCVVASRLSENSCVNVLLLEAGKEPPFLTEVPGLARYLVKYEQNWQFMTVPQKHTAGGLINRVIYSFKVW